MGPPGISAETICSWAVSLSICCVIGPVIMTPPWLWPMGTQDDGKTVEHWSEEHAGPDVNGVTLDAAANLF